MERSTNETHLAQARTAPDYLATRTTSELQAIFRETATMPLEQILNRGTFRVDVARQRIWRDSFWKGTFARDRFLGWDEYLLSPTPPDGSHYTGGRFWKRFDAIVDGVANGQVVNFNIGALPGLPTVREVVYPTDQHRRYITPGDRLLLLTYGNHPYRAVYDLIKIVGPDACVGVMHLGSFPRGLEFSTFVLSRNNYPFVNMTVPDHDALFDSETSRVPKVDEIAGRWRGRLVFSRAPELTLHNQFNPRVISARFETGPTPSAVVRAGLIQHRRTPVAMSTHLRLVQDDERYDELRLIPPGTLLGRRFARSRVPLRRYVLTPSAK